MGMGYTLGMVWCGDDDQVIYVVTKDSTIEVRIHPSIHSVDVEWLRTIYHHNSESSLPNNDKQQSCYR